MNDDDQEYTIQELELLERWLTSRINHLSSVANASTKRSRKHLLGYLDTLHLELTFVVTILTSKCESGDNGLQGDLPLDHE